MTYQETMMEDGALGRNSFRGRTRSRKCSRLTPGESANHDGNIWAENKSNDTQRICRHVDQLVLVGYWIIAVGPIEDNCRCVPRGKS